MNGGGGGGKKKRRKKGLVWIPLVIPESTPHYIVLVHIQIIKSIKSAPQKQTRSRTKLFFLVVREVFLTSYPQLALFTSICTSNEKYWHAFTISIHHIFTMYHHAIVTVNVDKLKSKLSLWYDNTNYFVFTSNKEFPVYKNSAYDSLWNLKAKLNAQQNCSSFLWTLFYIKEYSWLQTFSWH